MAEDIVPELSPEDAQKAKKRAYHLAWSARNRARINGYRLNRLAREGDALREAKRDYWRQYYESHKEEHAAAVLRWQRNNPDKVAAQAARWYAKAKAKGGEAFLEKQRAKTRIQWAKHGATYREQHKQWLREHPEIKLAGNRKRRARKAGAPINDFTPEQWESLCAAVKYRCCYCGKKFPIEDLTPDHLTPYNDKGSNTLHNVLPCCGLCNSRKGPRAVLKPVQPFLLLSDKEAAD